MCLAMSILGSFSVTVAKTSRGSSVLDAVRGSLDPREALALRRGTERVEPAGGGDEDEDYQDDCCENG